MVQPDPIVNDHPPPPLDVANEQRQRAPPQLHEAYEPHQQEPRPQDEAYVQHEQEPRPLDHQAYEQHEQEPRPLDHQAYEQHQQEPRPLDHQAYEQHQQEPRPQDEAYDQHDQQEPRPLDHQAYEQHQQEQPQQGIPMPQPPAVEVNIINNINGVPPLEVAAPQRQYRYPQLWHTGLFDCVDDLENAIITLFCPCVTFGQIAAALDNGSETCNLSGFESKGSQFEGMRSTQTLGWSACVASGCIYTCVALVIGLPCIISCTYRTKLRFRLGLVEGPCSDCMTHCCCEYCALCQEYRELNYRGYNPSAGNSLGVINPLARFSVSYAKH
ncbi:hypothetical protein OSB04_014682, partial [Centaurea solstitialis]